MMSFIFGVFLGIMLPVVIFMFLLNNFLDSNKDTETWEEMLINDTNSDHYKISSLFSHLVLNYNSLFLPNVLKDAKEALWNIEEYYHNMELGQAFKQLSVSITDELYPTLKFEFTDQWGSETTLKFFYHLDNEFVDINGSLFDNAAAHINISECIIKDNLKKRTPKHGRVF